MIVAIRICFNSYFLRILTKETFQKWLLKSPPFAYEDLIDLNKGLYFLDCLLSQDARTFYHRTSVNLS